MPPSMPLEALLVPDNLTDSDSDGIDGGTGCNFIFLLCRLLVVGPVLKWLALCITVPTTCSRPNIEMLGFMYLCITVPTTCSRHSIEMLGFMYLCIYFSVDGVLATPFDILCSNFVSRFVRTV